MSRFQSWISFARDTLYFLLLFLGERRGECQATNLKASILLATIPTNRSFSEHAIKTRKDHQRIDAPIGAKLHTRNRYLSSIMELEYINPEKMETFWRKPRSVNTWNSAAAFPNKAAIPPSGRVGDIRVNEKDDRIPQDLKLANRQDAIMTRGIDDDFLPEPSLLSVEAAPLAGCDGAISEVEYQALQDLYTSTGGPDWFWHNISMNQTEWIFPSNLTAPCSDHWEGVYCARSRRLEGEGLPDAAACSVTGISLPLTHLRGQLPASVANLSQLEIFVVDYNLLTGQIPSSLGDLTALTILGMHSNFMTGTIPASLGSLTALTVLDFYSNLHTGTIPASLVNLYSLTVLNCQYNLLNGTIPAWLSELTSLTSLTLGGNRLTGTIPSSLSNLVELRVLTLYVNSLNGTIPSSIGDMTALSILFMDRNSLTGPIPSSLGNMSSIKVLDLATNLLTGPIPSSLGNLTGLEDLNLNSNYLTGPMPSTLGNLTALKMLTLTFNSLNGTIPSAFSGMAGLAILYLNGNSLAGPIPNWLGNLTALTVMDLSSNPMNGTIPPSLGNATALTLLYLEKSSLTGTIPSSLSGLTNLEQLYLRHNSLTGPIPTSLGEQTSFTVLVLNGNLLNGTIPSSLSNLTALKILYLYDNLLTGPIPSSMGNLGALLYLDLEENFLNGAIPSSLGNLTALNALSLNENSLTGSIPSSLGGLTNLLLLSLYSNVLTGSIPSSLGNISGLKQLALYSNFLVGPIPSSLGNLTVLTELELYSNSLTGTIPSSLGLLANCYYTNMSSNSLVGSIPAELGGLGSNLSLSAELFGVGVTLDLSQNAFSGTISPLLFSEQMQTIILYSNCMEGSLPAEICLATSLQVLVLDKLTSGASCQGRVPGFSGIFTATTLEGSIPECILTMPRLQTLHLSGNGLHGSLGEIGAGSELINVDISNNFLTGSIPSSLQNHDTLQQLVLGNNKLSGTLSASFVVGNLTDIALAVNRLSGGIPAAFASTPGIKNLAILTGNLFACGNFLPASDPASASYLCGSSSFNIGLYFSGSSILLLCLVVSCAFLYHSRWVQCRYAYMDNLIGQGVAWLKQYTRAVSRGTSFHMLIGLVERLRLWLCWVGIFYAVICMPVYALLKTVTSAGVVSEQYTWVTSSAFLHDYASATVILIFTLFSGMLLGLIVWRLDLILMTTSSTSTTPITMIPPQQSLAGSVKWEYVSQRVALQVISLGVVLIVNALYVYGVVLGNLTLAEQLLALSALGLFKLFWQQLFVSYAISWMARSHDDISEGGLVFHQTTMNVITFILCPYLATLGADSNCLYYAVQGSPSISSSFSITLFRLYCLTLAADIESLEIECTEVPYRQLNTISIIPPWFYSYECTSALLTNYIPVLLFTFAINAVVVPLLQYWLMTLPKDPKSYLLWLRNLRKENATSGRKLVADILLDATVLMTFGLAAPLLGLIIVLKQVTFAVLNRMTIGRYLQLTDDIGAVLIELEEAAQQFRGGGTWALLLFLVCVVGIFWGAMIFDMVADLYGNIAGGIAWAVVFAVWTAVSLTAYKFAAQITGLTARFSRRPKVVFGSSAVGDTLDESFGGGLVISLAGNASMFDKQERGAAQSNVSRSTSNPVFSRESDVSMFSDVDRESLNLMHYNKRRSDVELTGL